MRLIVEWITDPVRFAALQASWDLLAARDGSPFAQHRWSEIWWESFGSGLRLEVPTVWEGDRLVAAAPLVCVGRELRLMANIDAPLSRLVYEDDAALDALGAAIAAHRGPVHFEHLPTGGGSAGRLAAAMRANGKLVISEPAAGSPMIDLDGTWDEYQGRMKSRWSSAARKARKMAREHDAVFTLLSGPADLDTALKRGLELEASGWKGRSGTAILSNPVTERYIRSIAEAFNARGQLAISEISLDGRCVAFDLGLITDTRLYCLKTAYDERIGSLSPGLVLRTLIVERSFELGLEVYELLGSDSDWKRRFANGMDEHVNLWARRHTPAGLSRHASRRMVLPVVRSVRDSLRDFSPASRRPIRGRHGSDHR